MRDLSEFIRGFSGPVLAHVAPLAKAAGPLCMTSDGEGG